MNAPEIVRLLSKVFDILEDEMVQRTVVVTSILGGKKWLLTETDGQVKVKHSEEP